MDEYIEEFLHGEGFSPAYDSLPVSEDTLNYYDGKLPDRLIGYWRDFGFCGYGKGLFWTVNPSDYQDIADKWLKQTNLWDRSNFYVIARSAFGELYLRDEWTNRTTKIEPHFNVIFPCDIDCPSSSLKEKDRGIGIFFEGKSKKSVDFYDKDDKLLFNKCLKKLGPLSSDEMYSFVPALALGGVADIKNVQKVKIIEHLEMLSDLEAPQVMKSSRELFGSI